jgi:spermidine synthase
MLTQKALAHLPLLMHERPSQVALIGLGSGVTLASALVHPVTGVDVIELSPEVVEASHSFIHENGGALSDPRTRLIVGDGRTHLLLSDRRYDVIVSEPSNPWMAGVATLFTREFFLAARDRLTPGGLLCQWTHTYNMSEADLRSIVATFASVFPHGTMWKVGDGDLLLIGSGDEAPPALANIAHGWNRPGVAADLGEVGAEDPFALLSMFLGASPELRAFAAGAALQADDRLALEFSGPFAALSGGASDNEHVLERLSRSTPLPEPVARALADADARAWRNRGAMMLKAGAHDAAYTSFARAVAADSSDRAALDGLVDTALTIDRYDEALHTLRQVTADRPDDCGPLIALSKLHASAGRFDEAVAAAIRASEIRPTSADAMEQLASIYADLGDEQNLSPISAWLRRTFPDRSGTFYYSAAAEFLAGRLAPALEAIEHAVSIDGGSANVHNLRGAIHARLGRVADARAAFQTALTLDPRDSATYANYGLLELALGNREDAANLFGEALALDPASPVGRQGIAEAQLTSQ